MRVRFVALSVLALAVAGCGNARPAESPQAAGDPHAAHADHAAHPDHAAHAHAAGSSSTRVTEPFRQEHVELKTHLGHVRDWNGKLPTQAPAEQVKTMKDIVGFFEGHLGPHAKWEEANLYNSVDKRASSGPNPFTASMRFEHRVIERWIGDLRRIAEAPSPDVTDFIRRTDNLLGLVTAHFEAEEEVLLPILDATMTPEDFARELGHHEGGGHH